MTLPPVTPDLSTVAWVHGAEGEPLLQVVRWQESSFALRVSKRYSFEANWLYLLRGADRALLLDTGPAPDLDVTEPLPLRETVDALAGNLPLVVAHTHGHGDHVAGDALFRDRPRTTLVGLSLTEVRTFWHLPDWPEGEAAFDLGDRPLTVFPIPGHEATHVALWDPCTGALIAGDTLYPGLLTVRDWPAFRASAARMARFAATHPVSMVLGHHVEMTRSPGRLYPLGTRFQPDEHPLPLPPDQIRVLHEACEAVADAPRDVTADHFAIEIRPGAVPGRTA